jgi:hypothetical protein
MKPASNNLPDCRKSDEPPPKRTAHRNVKVLFTLLLIGIVSFSISVDYVVDYTLKGYGYEQQEAAHLSFNVSHALQTQDTAFYQKNHSLITQMPTNNNTTIQRRKQLPPLNEVCQHLYNSNKLYASNVCQLVDFAVAGFAKCGTTSIGLWLASHPNIASPKVELNGVHKAIKSCSVLYKTAQSVQKRNRGSLENVLIGYRNPHNIQRPDTLKFYRHSCPTTKLIILVRHPVLWFQSFYNYRVVRKEWWSLNYGVNGSLLANDMVDPYVPEPFYVSIFVGAFHQYLARLGLTSLQSEEERSLLVSGRYNSSEFNNAPVPLKNPIMLLEMSQLDDDNTTRLNILKEDIQSFLGLPSPLGPIPQKNSVAEMAKKRKPLKPNEITKSKEINICDSKHDILRSQLMDIGANASIWIQQYFLDLPSVHVSSRSYLDALLDYWRVDPCT